MAPLGPLQRGWEETLNWAWPDPVDTSHDSSMTRGSSRNFPRQAPHRPMTTRANRLPLPMIFAAALRASPRIFRERLDGSIK